MKLFNIYKNISARNHSLHIIQFKFALISVLKNTFRREIDLHRCNNLNQFSFVLFFNIFQTKFDLTILFTMLNLPSYRSNK